MRKEMSVDELMTKSASRIVIDKIKKWMLKNPLKEVLNWSEMTYDLDVDDGLKKSYSQHKKQAFKELTQEGHTVVITNGYGTKAYIEELNLSLSDKELKSKKVIEKEITKEEQPKSSAMFYIKKECIKASECENYLKPLLALSECLGSQNVKIQIQISAV